MKELISTAAVAKRVQELGEEITRYYTEKKAKRIVIIGVLKGSFIFLADLVRSLKIPLEIEFIEVSSYGASTRSSGNIQLIRDIAVPLEDEEVLVVEDIIDTGNTLFYLLEHLRRSHRPRSTAVASLLFKPSRQVRQMKPDFLGFTIEDHFVVGYGLDFNNRFRELPYIGIYENSDAVI